MLVAPHIKTLVNGNSMSPFLCARCTNAREGAAKTETVEGNARGTRDNERRGLCIYCYRLSRDGERVTEPTILAMLLEPSFSVVLLFLPIHIHLHELLELLLACGAHMSFFFFIFLLPSLPTSLSWSSTPHVSFFSFSSSSSLSLSHHVPSARSTAMANAKSQLKT